MGHAKLNLFKVLRIRFSVEPRRACNFNAKKTIPITFYVKLGGGNV